MKKTIITLLVLSGAAMADLTDGLQWGESFGDGYDKSPAFTIDNAFTVADGVGSTTVTYEEGKVVEDGRPEASDLTAGNFTDSFTFSFELVDFDAGNWQNAFSLYTNENPSGATNVLNIQKNKNSELMVYTSKFTDSNVADDASNFCLGTIANLKGKQITLTMGAVEVNGVSVNVLTGYVDGVAITDTVTFTYAEGVTPSTAITGFKFGSQLGGDRSCTSVTVDNIYLWNRALSAAEVATIPAAIPEPTTATLSLLALAGLAARRRRR